MPASLLLLTDATLYVETAGYSSSSSSRRFVSVQIGAKIFTIRVTSTTTKKGRKERGSRSSKLNSFMED